MSRSLYPSFSIKNLEASKSKNDLLNADRFKEYLVNNPHLQVLHTHSFYHLVYFTQGSGEHIMDFKKFKVQKGMIYFMRPGQVHNWQFKGAVDGYIINFSPTFFDSLFINSNFIDQFVFFDGNLANQVLYLSPAAQKTVVTVFEQIIREQIKNEDGVRLMIASLLLQLFLTINRTVNQPHSNDASVGNSAAMLKKFQALVENKFREMKLPKEYASQLYITPHRLNALCNEFLHMSAGEFIRNRAVLEAKRLLVNFELSIADIALELNFADASYFVKFFKKYTGATPDAFRNAYYTH